ncbi:MAG: PD-(D/E)XK nuclease family protein, partial [Planctomycetota bacterium]
MQESLQKIGSICKQHLLAEKWLLAADQRIANLWKEQLVRIGFGTLNLHAHSLRSLVLSLSAAPLAERGVQLVDSTYFELLIQEVLANTRTKAQLRFLDSDAIQVGAVRLLARTFEDLRLAGQDVSALPSKHFENPERCHDLKLLFSGVSAAIGERGLVDWAGCLELATQAIQKETCGLPVDLQVIVPERLELRQRERQFLDALLLKASVHKWDESDAASSNNPHVPPKVGSAGQLSLDFEEPTTKPDFFHAFGPVNEVREALKRILYSDSPSKMRLDGAEILYSDYHSYVPTIYGLLAEYWHSIESEGEQTATDLPVTFSEGIACIHARPGRALRSWLRWIRTDYLQVKSVQFVREGLLVRPKVAQEMGYSRLANALRRIPIGFGRQRYHEKIGQAVVAAQHKKTEYEKVGDREDSDGDGFLPTRDFGLKELLAVQQMLKPLLELAPTEADTARRLLDKVLQFLQTQVRAENKIDRSAKRELLQAIQARFEMLPSDDLPSASLWSWLEELPTQLRLARSSPQPGCLHVSPLRQGGYSGRNVLFLLGLDERKHPQRVAIDPFLLDAERARLSDDLPTSQSKSLENAGLLGQVLDRVMDREHAKLTLSYATAELNSERVLLPSARLIAEYRKHIDPKIELDSFLDQLGAPKSFVEAASATSRFLDRVDWQLTKLLSDDSQANRTNFTEEEFPLLKAQSFAEQKRNSSDFGAYDGFVPAANLLNPVSSDGRVSSSRLETYGNCPRRFFFRYVLSIYPPEELELEDGRWLDALQTGNLLHDLFERFMVQIKGRGHTPDAARDLPELLEMLSQAVDQLKEDIPVRNAQAFLAEYMRLEDMCGIFLRKEQTYYKNTNAKPWVLEASIGLGENPAHALDSSEPVALKLKGGRVLHVAGRVDRVDILQPTPNSSSESNDSYIIWDYKSGSDYSFREGDEVIAKGKKLQPLLYLGMLRQRLKDLGKDPDAVV